MATPHYKTQEIFAIARKLRQRARLEPHPVRRENLRQSAHDMITFAHSLIQPDQ